MVTYSWKNTARQRLEYDQLERWATKRIAKRCEDLLLWFRNLDPALAMVAATEIAKICASVMAAIEEKHT